MFERSWGVLPGSLFLLTLNDHGGSNFDALEKAFGVMVMHADTSFGHGLANACRVIRSMNPIMWDRKPHPATTKGTAWIYCFSGNGVVTVGGGGCSLADCNWIMMAQPVSFIKLKSTTGGMNDN